MKRKLQGAMQQLDERLVAASLSPQGGWRISSLTADDLISYNSAELAQLSGVSKATVSRLFKRLGYDKYGDMRDELRTLRRAGCRSPTSATRCGVAAAGAPL